MYFKRLSKDFTCFIDNLKIICQFRKDIPRDLNIKLYHLDEYSQIGN